jgi:adenylate cyclase
MDNDNEAEIKDNNKNLYFRREIIDLMLEEQTSKKDVHALKTIAESRARTVGALKNESRQFHSYIESSEKYLRSHLGSKIKLVILYVDLVGSTHMSMVLPLEKLTTIIQIFAQEMTVIIANNNGYILKYVGDAIIAYFPADTDFHAACKRALECAMAMLLTVEHGVNVILKQYDFPDLHIKVGIDSGENAIIDYGSKGEKSHVDLIGYPMNLTAKITSLAEPDHILIGNITFQCLNSRTRNMLTSFDLKSLDYIDHQTGDAYVIFSFCFSIR